MGSVIDEQLAGSPDEDKGAATIFALSSGAPPAGIAVVRVSGARAFSAIEALTGRPTEVRRATLRTIADPRTGETLDRAIVLFFDAASSFTGEDVAEFQVHGGRAVVSGVLQALGSLPGIRPAEPGEFTRRAFVNGRIDLTEAEGIADLVAADTVAQRRAALEEVQGSIRRRFESWAGELLRARGLLEAEIDFAEEEDLGTIWAREGRELAAEIGSQMDGTLAGFDRARSIREGLEVMLIGPVNAGKSTLLNAISGREAAIVSSEGGTTRDLIEVAIELQGQKVTLIDGAGLRESDGSVEQEGIRRARQRAEAADLVLWLSEAAPPPADVQNNLWRVATKIDLAADDETIRYRNEADYCLSAKTGDGVDTLCSALASWAEGRTAGSPSIVRRERHRAALAEAADAIRGAVVATEPELAAEKLRIAGDALGRITGRVDADAVLDIVFGEFCIGK